ncbi:MAG: YkgJ family cysteine cluster protein [Janthinobacterium lividum]
MYPAGDSELVQIVDEALADAARRSGDWLACRPGCNQCCTGVFRISALDAARLQVGLRELQHRDPQVAADLRQRIARSHEALSTGFPGNPITGILSQADDAEEAFDSFAEDATCPVLDPATGTCNLYTHRPMTCRTFGPPVWTGDGGYGVCELCFVGAPAEEVKRSELNLPDPELEHQLTQQVGCNGDTIVAFAFGRALA